jgi:hypothetical protein
MKCRKNTLKKQGKEKEKKKWSLDKLSMKILLIYRKQFKEKHENKNSSS